MIAIRKVDERGNPTQEVLVVNDEVARLAFRNGTALPANGREADDEHLPEGLPKVEEGAEVVGLTDKDPDFFEKQAAQAKERDLSAVVGANDRMQRGGRQKG